VEICEAALATVELCDVSDTGLSALLETLPASYSCDRNLGTHKAPRIDNSDPYNVALIVNGRIIQNIVVATGCEMVVVGKTAARQAGIRPSMMRAGAVALRCADERIKKAFDRTVDPVTFVFNPGTKDETTVRAHVVVTNTEADTMLLGMSVIGKIGLVPNPYKGTLKYYVDWETRGSRSARLACTFNVELGGRRNLARSTAYEIAESKAALVMPMESVPQELNAPYEFVNKVCLHQIV
jgi:predicted aspartyl protease